MFTCAYCDKSFKYESEKTRHEKSHIPQFECSECFKKFSFVSALKRHQKQHQRTGSVICSDCGKSFRDESLLQRHKKYAHKETHICVKCQAKFNSLLALHSHHKTHKPKSERRYQCSNTGCTKTFNFIHHLRHHELTHSSKKQHYCNLCGKGFIQLHHLKTHLKNHEPQSWLKCIVTDCNKFFTTENALRRHLATHRMKTENQQNETILDFSKENEGNIEDNVQINSNIINKEVQSDDWFEKYPVIEDIFIKDNLQTISNSGCDNDFNKVVVSEDCIVKGKLDVEKGNTENNCHRCNCQEAKEFTSKKMPKLRYNSDGTIKIVELVDSDIKVISIVKNDDNKVIKKNDASHNFVPYNSCKAVLGSCIVSGNGTINEECLCAKMAIDDTQLISQEIDEITPHPMQVYH